VEGGNKGWQRGGVGVAVPEDLGLGSLSQRLKNHGFAESFSGGGGGSAEEEGGGGFNIGSIGALGRRQVKALGFGVNVCFFVYLQIDFLDVEVVNCCCLIACLLME